MKHLAIGGNYISMDARFNNTKSIYVVFRDSDGNVKTFDREPSILITAEDETQRPIWKSKAVKQGSDYVGVFVKIKTKWTGNITIEVKAR